MLEVMHLYNDDYAISHASPPSALELLEFPSICNSIKRESGEPLSGQNAARVQQHPSGHQLTRPVVAQSLIEKPWEHNGGSLDLETGIPPAEYQFTLPERDQALVEQGTKTLEIRYVLSGVLDTVASYCTTDQSCSFSFCFCRLNVAPYSIIHVNDRITINGKTSTTVVAIRKYSRLQSVLEAENVNSLLPQSSFVGAGTFNASAAAERHYRHYFSADEENQYGLVVFQLAVSASSSSAPKSQEEWSGTSCVCVIFMLKLIYNYCMFSLQRLFFNNWRQSVILDAQYQTSASAFRRCRLIRSRTFSQM
ncbi:unnamed protein product [Phytophthora lilii]|uniref:Unnamed protein product n=1 Tax=Phytophthora lilii TaxID=2077276 RepID=A0A9W6U812_9STRA|nr:unnamed protein product [Phytophthora lilii]